MPPVEIVLAIWGAGIVGVGSSTKTELVRVETLAVLERQAVLQGLAGIAANDMGDAPFGITKEISQYLEIG
jgi:hypothetical protein